MIITVTNLKWPLSSGREFIGPISIEMDDDLISLPGEMAADLRAKVLLKVGGMPSSFDIQKVEMSSPVLIGPVS